MLEAYIAANAVPVSPLHAQGFPSIGCQPCTRAVRPGEDIRAGRCGGSSRTARNAACTIRPSEKPHAPSAARKPPHEPPAIASRLLEAESIHIFREAAAQFRRPVLLYSIGKDSTVLLHLARKAFYPARPPFPLLHIDTTWKFRDMIAFRDRTAETWGSIHRAYEPERARTRRHAFR